MVKILLQFKKKLDTNLNDALKMAIEKGCSAIVDELVKAGTNVNHVDENKNTPLILAVEHANPIAEFYRQAQDRMTSRWEARKKIIHILLQAGANATHVNKYGETALMKAVENYDVDTVQDLVKIPAMTRGSFLGF